jgi:hypothetical protein
MDVYVTKKKGDHPHHSHPHPTPITQAFVAINMTSSAETASEIQTHLTSLRKSRQSRSLKKAEVAALDRADALTLDKLRRVFGRLKEDGSFDCHAGSKSAAKESASAKWISWLNTQLDAFLSTLVEYVGDDKTFALRTFCGVIATFPSVASDSCGGGNKDILSEKLLTKLLEAVLKSKKVLTDTSTKERSADEAMLNLLDGEFIQQYRDVQYYVLMVVQKMAVQLLDGLEKDRKERGVKDDANEGKTNVEQNVEIVAENMARLLLKMDYVAKSQEDLLDDSLFLYPPAAAAAAAPSVVNDNADETQDDTTESGSDESDAESSDEDEVDNDKQTSSSNTKQPTNKKSKLPPIQKAYNHRNLLQEAWLSILRLPIPPRTTKLILQHVSTYILPLVPTPLRFAEYFTNSFRVGSTTNNNANSLTSILALHGLFQLILNHQLEYPQFYPSLYKLLHPRILYTKHRSRFLRLLSKSLMANTMLPAYVVAAFCKKLLRLGLSGPPSGALFVLALVSNLIRKHGEVGCLIHRKGGMIEDVFCEDAEDLMETRGEIF